MPTRQQATTRRPNVLLIMADQLRWDAVGAYWPQGQSPVRTPNLDRIAREGARFDRCYTASPICMPARASVMTGRWPHAHGLWDNGVRLPQHTTTIATVLAQHGYRTAIAGKGHLDVHNLLESPDSFDGWNTPEAIALGAKDGWHGPYYGFTEAYLTAGHNKPSGRYGTWLHTHHPGAVPLMQREHALEEMGPNAWKSALPVELHASTWIGDRSVEFVTSAAGQPDRPWCLLTSFPDPHSPLCPPKEYADRYDPAAMPAPLRRPGELADKPPHFRGEADAHAPDWRPFGVGHISHEPRDEGVDAQDKAAYYAMTELLDHNIGRILAALEQTGQLDNTVILVIADHGDLLGDHWLDAKGPWHYDGCTRVPLLVRYPRAIAAGAVVDGFASQCDVAPTLCDLLDIPYTTWPPTDESYANGRLTPLGSLPDVQGISLVPAAQGTAPARPHVFMETEWRWVPGLQLKTLRTPDYRLTVYAGRPYGELYDLRQDPHEFVNRWDDPALRTNRLELTELLLQQVMTTEGRLPPRLVQN